MMEMVTFITHNDRDGYTGPCGTIKLLTLKIEMVTLITHNDRDGYTGPCGTIKLLKNGDGYTYNTINNTIMMEMVIFITP